MSRVTSSVNLKWKALFGMLPGTSKVDKKETTLYHNLKRYNEILHSDKLENYKKLNDFVNSSEFKQKKEEIEALKYKNSTLHQKEKRFKQLDKSKQIKKFYSVKNSEDLKKFNETAKSQELADYEKLKEKYNEAKNTGKEKDFKLSDDYKKLLELEKNQAIKEYYRFYNSKKHKIYLKIANSEILDEYNKLKEYLNSDEFYKEKEKLKQEKKYKKSELAAKEKRLRKLEKNKNIKKYFEIQNSQEFADFTKTKNSAELKQYEELKQAYKKAREEGRVKEFKESDDSKRLKELEKSPDIKHYYKFKNTKDYKLYESLKDSETIKEYEDLYQYVHSDDFKNEKEYLKRTDKFTLTDEYKKQQELEKLKKDEDIIWFHKKDKSTKFAETKKWNITFNEDFSNQKIDTNKWLTLYYNSYRFLNKPYSVANERHLLTNGQNLEFPDHKISIVTRKENSEGIAWFSDKGFYPATFNYTSGIINTGHVFKQKYGVFTAKIKADYANPVIHGFWLASEKMLPEIDVVKYGNNIPSAYEVNAYTGDPDNINQNTCHVKGINPGKDYYIFSLEWTPERLTWKINNIKTHEITEDVPQEPLFIVFSSGLEGEGEPSALPAQMSIDWVRAYKKKDE